MVGNVKQEISLAFKLHGYTLKSDACTYLIEILSNFDSKESAQWIENIVSCLQKQPLESSVLDQNVLETAVKECSEQDQDEEFLFEVIDVFSLPRFEYNRERKKFLETTTIRGSEPQLHGKPESKAELYRSRYSVVHQRVLRHELFSASTVPGCENSQKFKLKAVEDLLGAAGKLKDIVVLGMLTQLKSDKFFLEDPSGHVELDLTKTTFHTGLFSENSIVLAEGWYADDILHVTAMGFPPTESAQLTRSYFGNANFFGGTSKTNVKNSAKFRQMELQNQDATIVFLSDVWMDDTNVQQGLSRLFGGFESSVPPVCFVFCGNFCSKSYGNQQIKVLKDSFSQLADIMVEFPQLIQKSRFVFIPSLQDPGMGNIIPRPPLPVSVTSELSEKVPNCYFASNPCRLRYCTQEIVVFREDVIEKMCRNCIQMPSTHKEIAQHFVKTIQSQAHLSPLPIHVSPVYWQYDHCLRLYPLADLIVICDKVESFTHKQNDCIVTNPGSFGRNDLSFQVYAPAAREVEDSAVG